jgi:hypothetical protein
VARVDGDLKERLGEPVGLGKWYNSSVGLRSGSHGQVRTSCHYAHRALHSSRCRDSLSPEEASPVVTPRVQVADCVVGVAGQRRSGHVSLTMSRDAASDRGILFHHLFGDGVWRLDKASILVPDATKGASAHRHVL